MRSIWPRSLPFFPGTSFVMLQLIAAPNGKDVQRRPVMRHILSVDDEDHVWAFL
jgi:hypothetical protein